jgi:hypothetical protein
MNLHSMLARRLAGAPLGVVMLAGVVSACAPSADQPMKGPVEAMEAPWGPFARQCATTRVSYTTTRFRVGNVEVGDNYETCIGYSAMPAAKNAVEITASVGDPNRPSTPVILRIVRNTGGAAREAAAGDTGLLAQGSEAPGEADLLARDIGLTSRQLISPNDTLALPVRLSLPFPLDVVMACRPDGGHQEHGRETLVFSCTLDQTVRTDHVDGQVRLEGVEEIDVQTGIRLSGVLSGHLTGRVRAGDGGAWQAANDRLLYRQDTEYQ